MSQVDSPKPVTKAIEGEDEQEVFIGYPPVGEMLEQVPIYLNYISRTGFLLHTLKLYLHEPWIALELFQLNNAIMRDERNLINERLKYRLSFIASPDNECTYCIAHTVKVLKNRWGYVDGQLEDVLHQEPKDEREAVAMEFVYLATLDLEGVTNEMGDKLSEYFTPQEVMEIILIIGFWKVYNAMHTVMGAPLEDPLLDYKDWANVQLDY